MAGILLLTGSVLLPITFGVICYMIKKGRIRDFVAALFGIVVLALNIALFDRLFRAGGVFSIAIKDSPFDFNWVVELLSVFILIYFIYLGIRLKRNFMFILSIVQLIPFALLEIFYSVKKQQPVFIVDYQAVTVNSAILVVGLITTVFTIRYMRGYERNLGLKRSAQPSYYLVLFTSISAVNTLTITDNMLWMYFFWMASALCAFYLVSFIKDSMVDPGALQLMIFNLSGGVLYILAVCAVYIMKKTLSIGEIVLQLKPYGSIVGLFPLCMTLVSFAGVIRSVVFRLKED
ncbi:MAG TPA: hypothetical protein GXX14_06545 [Clostridiaceae bacterium]|nr:hypothetical protein [Clostridiaceae bacterium]